MLLGTLEEEVGRKTMTDDALLEEIAAYRNRCQSEVAICHERIADLVEECERRIKKAIEESGRKLCPTCHGHGAIQRLDAGYMRRFGLREWNGCPDCGGDGHEVKGKGFVEP